VGVLGDSSADTDGNFGKSLLDAITGAMSMVEAVWIALLIAVELFLLAVLTFERRQGVAEFIVRGRVRQRQVKVS
jgi:hypothetical protein